MGLLSEEWLKIVAGARPEAASKKDDKPSKMLTTDELTDKAMVAERKGFSIGALVQEKGHGAKGGVYKIQSVGEEVVLFEEDPIKAVDSCLVVKFPFTVFLKYWNLFKGDLPYRWMQHGLIG